MFKLKPAQQYRVAAAVVGSAVVGGVLSNQAANTQADAAQSAANTSAAASNHAADLQYQQYQQTRADQEPWRQAGVNALGQLNSGTNGLNSALLRPFSMNDFQQDPGYQFRLDQGLKSLQASAAARGGLLSGNALKGINRYSQDYASNEYQNAYNRYQSNQTNAFNRLASMAGVGQTANNALQQAGQNYAGSTGNILMGNAANQGNAALAAGQARASSYQGLGNALGRGMDYFSSRQSAPYQTGGYENGSYNPNLLDQQYAQGWGYGD